jgi:phosphatidylserine decarboxylase
MRFPITEYGRKDLLIATIVCGALTALCMWFAETNEWGLLLAIVPVAVWLILVNFFRDPERTSPVGERLIVSPADGKVTDLEELDEPEFLGGRAVRLGIFLSPLNVHVNRAPMECEVLQVDYRRGAMHKAYDPRARTENEAASIRLAVLGGSVRMIVRQVTGALARRIVCPVSPGARLAVGERYGMIKLGSRTEVWLRADQAVTWRVKIGDTVKGGLTVLGELGPAPESTKG